MGTKNLNGAKSYVQHDKQIKKSLVIKGVKGMVTSGKDPIQLSFQIKKWN